MTTPLRQLIDGYVEAVFFTETGDGDQPESDSELSDSTRYRIERDCARFLSAYGEIINDCGASWEQVGHDYWLTRQGHGVGFLDRDDALYSEAVRDELTRACRFLGEVDEIVFKHQEGQTAFGPLSSAFGPLPKVTINF